MGNIDIKWQEGPVKEAGVNSVQIVDVLQVCRDRLAALDAEFPRRENSITLTKLDEAIMWQDKRAADREIRGVEGMNKA
ncbi:hypothetical protein JZO70_10285 [Enterococcus sp. 669A]|uniref:Acb2/Tad1 hairpin domain-containing protein n=1 Tax=Candidatus Enterococcus moelleringii TaxID=2815325 RepID=A0ABS3LA92_9ENTE|nr:hypothetical protein [Enterococcus sp. 669A]MBO1306552.1 hypothetical protein [Enterococcus sp. 669A]